MTAIEGINKEALNTIKLLIAAEHVRPGTVANIKGAAETMGTIELAGGIAAGAAVTGGAILPALGGGGAAAVGGTAAGLTGGKILAALTLGPIMAVIGGEALEWYRGWSQTGEGRTMTLLGDYAKETDPQQAAVLRAEAEKAMAAAGWSEDLKRVNLANADEARTSFAGKIELGAGLGVQRLPKETDEEYKTRVYTAQKEQLATQQKAQEAQAKTQQNLAITGTPSGQIEDIGGQGLSELARLQNEIAKNPQGVSQAVKNKVKELEATQTAGGRMGTMQAADAAKKAAIDEQMRIEEEKRLAAIRAKTKFKGKPGY